MLTINFVPATRLKTLGRIMIKSPSWYRAQAIGQDGVTSDYYTESMIGADSYGTISSNAGELTVYKTTFDDTNN